MGLLIFRLKALVFYKTDWVVLHHLLDVMKYHDPKKCRGGKGILAYLLPINSL